MSKADKLYVFLCMLFAVIVVVNNCTYQKFVALDLSLYTFELSVGAILYPVTFLISDLLAEFYGKNQAKFCVHVSILMNVTAALIINIMSKLPAVSWSKVDNALFDKIFGLYGVAFVGSIIASYCAQTLDIKLYLLIKNITNDKYLWIRNNISTAIALLVDTVLVISFMTLFGALPYDHMWQLIFNSYAFKVFFAFTNTPLFYLMVSLIKRYFNKQ